MKYRFNWFPLLLLSLMGSAFAGQDNLKNSVATVTSFQGQVKYHKDNSPRGKKLKDVNFALYVNDSIRTKKASRVTLNLIDDTRIILIERSSIRFNGPKEVTADQGLVLFDVKKQKQLNGFQVRSKVAVIGVKGTQFIVDSREDATKIFMKEGLVSIGSVDGDFKRYKRKEKEAFDRFQDNINQEFKDFNQDLKKDYYEFVKSFDIGAGKAVYINGNEVRDIEIPADIQAYFSIFDEK